MAEELIAGVCSSGSWWCDGTMMSTPVSCSAQHTNVNGSFNWATVVDMFDVEPTSLEAMEFGLASTTSSWSQPFFGNIGRAESCLHGDMSSGMYALQESPMEPNQMHARIESSSLKNRDSNSFIRNIIGAQLCQEGCQVLQQPVLASHLPNNCKSSVNFHEDSNNDQSSRSSSDESLLQLTQSSLPKQQPQFSCPITTMTNEAPWSFNNPVPTHLVQHAFEETSSFSNQGVKWNPKAGDSEPALKKPRIETPSPLPTFKVRKEKLGDRITALQQLVSPFGKTDTASVLHEAIDYIKFLHDQVRALSAPHHGNIHQIQQAKEDLRSRGLCLVPVSATFAVARQSPMDFWTPFLGGTYR